MKCCYHPGYRLVLPGLGGSATGTAPESPAPLAKGALLRERLLAEGVLRLTDFVEPEPIDLELARLVHSVEYLDKLQSVGLTRAEERLLGMPWSPGVWRRSQLAAGGTLLAARLALKEGLAGNLAGGSHHAFADHGEGFCVLNDVAIASAVLLRERAVERIAIVDLDVHQGNGSAAIFADRPEVFTFSMHGERNYPALKMRSSLDIALANGTDDAEYLRVLDANLPRVLERGRPDVVFYLAGVDVAAGDRFGRLALTEDGIRRRDHYVVETVRGVGTPMVILLAGGYATTRERTAELHAHVFREAVAHERRVALGAAPIH